MNQTNNLLTPTEIVHKERCENTFQTIVQSVRVVKGCVPPNDQYEFYSAFPKYKSVISKLSGTVFNTINDILSSEKLSATFHPDSGEELDFTDKYDMMVEANDIILEKVGNLLDEVTGMRSAQPAIQVKPNAPALLASWNQSQNLGKMKTFSCLHSLPKPQNNFMPKPDNSTLPFIVILKDKPNCSKLLTDSYHSFINGKYADEIRKVNHQHILQRSFPFSRDFVEELTAHHYSTELDVLVPSIELLEPVMCQQPAEVSEKTFRYVDTESALLKMLEHLKGQTEIAIDTEAHDYRSFLGFICLIQISSRSLDFIVDAIALRSKLQILNVVFTDPKILKVLHGCDMDVLWLQRDFGLYLVNVFDTGQAARVLNYPTFALSYLLKRFINFDARKEFQLADWRERPLSADMLEYARMDTHALLYISDHLRNSLYELRNDSLFEVFNRSRKICMKKYTKPEFNDDSYHQILRKFRKKLTKQQEYVISKLYAWREEMARSLDESRHYVMPNHMLIRIGQVLPREAQGILACCNPAPPIVREYLSVIHKIVLEGKAKVYSEQAIEPSIKYQNISRFSAIEAHSFPHDSNKSAESEFSFEDDIYANLCAAGPKNVLLGAVETDVSEKALSSVLDHLENPLSKYLPSLDISTKFMTETERNADSLSFNLKKRGEKSKIQHRWRLSARCEQPKVSSNQREAAASSEAEDKATVEMNEVSTDGFHNEQGVPIIFKPSATATKPEEEERRQSKEESKMNKKRKRRNNLSEVNEVSQLIGSAEKKAKLTELYGKHDMGDGNENGEDFEHPSIGAEKKKKKKHVFGRFPLPRIRGFSNKSSSFKGH